MKALVDNDVLFKGACYGLLHDLIRAVCPQGGEIGVLGSARYVVPKKIERTRLRQSPSNALRVLTGFLNQANLLEPLAAEQKMAADLELLAQRSGVSLDTGESQLCSVLICRLLPLLMTGDKRAIVAIEGLLDADARLRFIGGKVLCLEQAFLSAVSRNGINAVRSAVCAEPVVDKALTICFSCHNESVAPEDHVEGLQSYIEHLRLAAPRVLVP